MLDTLFPLLRVASASTWLVIGPSLPTCGPWLLWMDREGFPASAPLLPCCFPVPFPHPFPWPLKLCPAGRRLLISRARTPEMEGAV